MGHFAIFVESIISVFRPISCYWTLSISKEKTLSVYISYQISDLDLSDRLLTTSKTSPAAQNRFIYFPDHLVRMPGPGLSIWGNLKNILNEPLFNQLPYSLSKEPRKPKRSPNLQDESVGSFISRRFGSAVADDIVSAIFHGIYAGDIYKLSARSIMPNFWFSETQHGSVIKGLIDAMVTGKQPVWRPSTDRLFLNALKTWHPPEEVVAALKSSVYTLQGGIGEIAAGLEKCLSYRVNGKTPIKIRKRRIVEQIAMKGHGRNAKVELIMSDLSTTKKSKIAREYSHVISTLPAKDLASIVSEKTPLRSLSTVRAVTVMVVNLFYRNPSLLPVKGFGYLLPRSLSIEQNPERALGVVFDSDAAIGQDRVEGTKLTVMIGGHWWDDYDSYPDAEEGESMAKRILARHLNITETPVAVRVGLQKDCIPQYEVGHEERLAQADKELKAFDGRLKVAGSSYTGVGLNDCVKAATACAYELMSGKGGTGLGFFAGDRFMDDTGK